MTATLAIAYADQDFTIVHGHGKLRFAGYAVTHDGERMEVFSIRQVYEGKRLEVEMDGVGRWVAVGKRKK